MKQIFSLEAEQSVIGGILLDNQAYENVSDLITKNSFYQHEHRILYGAMAEMLDENRPVDLVTLQEWLGSRNLLDDVGGFIYLVTVAQNTPSAANIRRYAQIVSEREKARNAILKAQTFIQDVQDNFGDAPIDEQIAGLARGLDDLAVSAKDDAAMFSALDLMKIAIEDFDQRCQNGGKFTGLSTGLHTLDEKLMGLQKGSLYVIAGRPAMGKTAVGMSIAEYVADHHDDSGSVVVFNLEMSERQLATRMVASAAEVELSNLQRGRAYSDEWERLETAVRKMERRKLLTDASSNLTVSKMRAKARKVKNNGGLSLILIDYLGLIDEPSKSFQSDNARIGYISRQIKLMAKELDVPVILLSQLSRKPEERADKRPMLSDLRDSGSIEQDADAVIFCYRDAYYSKDPNDDLLELIVAKQRMGETGTARCVFKGKYSKVTDASDEYLDAAEMRRESNGSNGKANGKRKREL